MNVREQVEVKITIEKKKKKRKKEKNPDRAQTKLDIPSVRYNVKILPQ